MDLALEDLHMMQSFQMGSAVTEFIPSMAASEEGVWVSKIEHGEHGEHGENEAGCDVILRGESFGGVAWDPEVYFMVEIISPARKDTRLGL